MIYLHMDYEARLSSFLIEYNISYRRCSLQNIFNQYLPATYVSGLMDLFQKESQNLTISEFLYTFQSLQVVLVTVGMSRSSHDEVGALAGDLRW